MTTNPATSALIARLRHGLLPAALTPMDAAGNVDVEALERYAEHLAGGAVEGIAVWAHTGRALHLDAAARDRVLATFRAATTQPIVAGAGVPAGADGDFTVETLRMAERAADGGADAIMVYPPAALGSLPEAERSAGVLRLHEIVAERVDLPIIGFYLHGEAGGYAYPSSLVSELLALPALAGIKLATLDRAIACQDTIGLITATSDRLALTGEDRMYGPSLLWGADTALVGIAAARIELSRAPLDTWNAGDHAGFVAASAALDRFAVATFRTPIEGYVQRMFWAAVREGVIPEHAAHDPFGPSLPAAERRAVEAV